jgi:hypothetical protein
VAEELLPEPTDAECWAYLEQIALTRQGLVLHNGNYSSCGEGGRPGLNVKTAGLRDWCSRRIKCDRNIAGVKQRATATS